MASTSVTSSKLISKSVWRGEESFLFRPGNKTEQAPTIIHWSGPLRWYCTMMSQCVYTPMISSFAGLPHFCSPVCVQYNTWKRKSVMYYTERKPENNKKGGWPGNEATPIYYDSLCLQRKCHLVWVTIWRLCFKAITSAMDLASNKARNHAKLQK